jgi:prophage regulatory protein
MENQMQMLSKREVVKRTNLSAVTIWRRVQVGDFPKPVQLTPNRIAWTEPSIEEWEASRPVGVSELPSNFKKDFVA